MKSILVSVMFPAWVWLKNPERRFLTASYASQLATRDSLKMRIIVQSPLYQRIFQPKWQLSDDQNQKLRFDNTSMGYRIATSVGGGVTGEGGDIMLIDDPLNAMDASSAPLRDEAVRWLKTVMSSRANNAKRNCRIMVMQRLHEEDPSGHVLKDDAGANSYERLILPARYEVKPKVKSRTSLNFVDPRRTEGELLWPERFDDKAVKELETDLDSTGLGQSHAQLQQDPIMPGGGLFKREWWKRYDKAPSSILETAQFWDCAQKPGISNDYTVCATWARTANGLYLLHLWREKTTAPLLEEMARSLYQLMRPDAIIIEDASAGSSLIQNLFADQEVTYPVIPFHPGNRDKEVRASAAAPTVHSGKCFLPNGNDLIEAFIAEHQSFPKASHDDQVDTTSMMVEYFVRRFKTTPRIRSL